VSPPPPDWQIGHGILDTCRVASPPGEWTHGWVQVGPEGQRPGLGAELHRKLVVKEAQVAEQVNVQHRRSLPGFDDGSPVVDR
jgi:hypothetical protein